MVAGDKRRRVEDVKALTYQYLEFICETIKQPRDNCLLALLYLSGRRINEILHLQKQDFKIEDKRISFETFNEKDWHSTQSGEYTVKRYVVFKDFKKRKTPPFKGYKYYRRIRPHWRTDSESGKCLTKYLLQRLGSLVEKDYVFKRLRGGGHIHYQMAYKIVRHYIPDAWPHLFRHERFTEISKAYQDNPVGMHRYTFHKRFESTLKYIRDLEEERI